MNAKRLLLASLVLANCAGSVSAHAMQAVYQINPGGRYTYLPSPEGPGIPGGIPSAYRLDFGIGGRFVYELDAAVPSARLLNLNLGLTGNEAIQAAPPDWAPVTADRVEEYLAGHTFVEDFIGGLLHLQSTTHENLKLTDGLNGSLAIHGGFDATPADGVGMLFDFSAVAIPTLPGDTNTDGLVNVEDLNNVRNNFGGAGLGDTLPFDGDVDMEDLNAVRNNFGEQQELTALEPSSLWPAMVGIVGLALARSRILFHGRR